MTDVAERAGWTAHPPRMGFFTDTSVCIGCKACEVACKEWNRVPDDGFNLLGLSYDNTGALGASTWRHVAFIEQSKPIGRQTTGVGPAPTGGPLGEAVGERSATGYQSPADPGQPGTDAGAVDVDRAASDARSQPPVDGGRGDVRWLMASDVCKHCTEAGCLDVCPTGALFRTEFGTVVVQEDVCNGCGYCVPACPFGVIDRRESDGKAWKCTLCYDRIGEGQTPACAKACPTESIQFGPLEELRERARGRVDQLVSAGVSDARLYGDDPQDGVGGFGAFFLLLDEPEAYGLPPDPVVPTRDLPAMWRHAAAAAGAFLALGVAAFAGRRR